MVQAKLIKSIICFLFPLFLSSGLYASITEQDYSHSPYAFKKDSLRVCLYYDEVPSSPEYKLGEIYSIMFQNLLGHFREAKVVKKPLKDYQSGDLSSCDRAAYIGSHYAAPMGDNFLMDIYDYERPFLWVNYGIWKLSAFVGEQDNFISKYGFSPKNLYSFDDPDSYFSEDPKFYKYFHYKGKRFRKYARYEETKKRMVTSAEIMLVENKDAEVLSMAEHTGSREKTPYVLHKNNFFYVADLPFSFIHESDRYLIFSDILFDFLQLPPRETKKNALMRLEDIHPRILPEEVYRTVNVMNGKYQNGVKGLPFTISVIPRLIDVTGYLGGSYLDVALNEYGGKEILKALKFATTKKARIIYHGYTHQDAENAECAIGVSGDGFEFWNVCSMSPLRSDSDKSIMDKLIAGEKILKDVGLPYDAWVTPHYQASALSYKKFAHYFPRTIQRMRYVPVNHDESDRINWAGQFFPYTIEKDFYGQWIWPEALGNVLMPFRKVCNQFLRSPEEIIESVRLLSVIRDSWASFFWHSYHFNSSEANRSLHRIVDAILEEGFEFIDIKQKKIQEDEERMRWDN